MNIKTSIKTQQKQCNVYNGNCFRILDCQNPQNLVNGLLSYTTTLYGDVAYVTCDAGFTASVNAITCTSSGTWSDLALCSPVGKKILYG